MKTNKLKAKDYIDAGDIWYTLDGADRDETCPICMTEFEESDDTVTACKNKHRFHRSCISDWTAMGSHKKCPVCRTKIVIRNYGEIEVDESVDSLRDVAWDGEKFVAVGHGRTIYGTSENGINGWTIISEFSEETPIFEGGGGDAICMNNQKIVIGGYVNVESEQSPIIYSNRHQDIVAYTETAKPPNISKILGLCWGGSCWGDGKFIAVGYNTENIPSGRTMIYSYDGEVWNRLDNNIFEGGKGMKVCWGNDMYVAVGKNSNKSVTIAYSYNGKKWFPASNNIFEEGEGNSVCWNGDKFVAVGKNSDGSVTIAYSIDGKEWVSSSNNIFSRGQGEAICWGNGKFVAIGKDNNIGRLVAYSTDGITWESNEQHYFPSGEVTGICWGDDKFVVVGLDGPSTIHYSFDGITFIQSEVRGSTRYATESILINGEEVLYDPTMPSIDDNMLRRQGLIDGARKRKKRRSIRKSPKKVFRSRRKKTRSRSNRRK